MPGANGWPRRAGLAVCAVLLVGSAVVYYRQIETSTQVQSLKPEKSEKPEKPEKSTQVPKSAQVTQPAVKTPAVSASKEGFPSADAVDGVTAEVLAATAPVGTSSSTLLPGLLPATTTQDPDIAQLRSRSLALPVQGINAARLTDTYTQARAAGRPHEALDIMAERGTPVLAVEDGEVVKLFSSRPGGITLYQFDPDRRYAYYYAHLDRYADGVLEGIKVRKGQVIGYVGSTGNALPGSPHLHFAIFTLGPERQWWRGTPLNPFLVWRDAKP